MFRRILIAWDGSKPALHALDIAIELGRRFEADLLAVSVAVEPIHAETHADRQESIDATRAHLEATLDQLRDRADRVGVPLKHVIVVGADPSREILRFAHEHAADLLIVGRHSTGRAGRLLLHGASEHIAAAATVPVLIVSEQNSA